MKCLTSASAGNVADRLTCVAPRSGTLTRTSWCHCQRRPLREWADPRSPCEWEIYGATMLYTVKGVGVTSWCNRLSSIGVRITEWLPHVSNKVGSEPPVEEEAPNLSYSTFGNLLNVRSYLCGSKTRVMSVTHALSCLVWVL